ncbi:hypothetical protein Ahia01_000154800, partial [Argonauta hians]
FYQCVHDHLVLQECPERTVWNKNISSCSHEVLAAPAQSRLVSLSEMCFYPNLTKCYQCQPGFYEDDDSCERFFTCANGGLVSMTCPEGTRWNQTLTRCSGGPIC